MEQSQFSRTKKSISKSIFTPFAALSSPTVIKSKIGHDRDMYGCMIGHEGMGCIPTGCLWDWDLNREDWVV